MILRIEDNDKMELENIFTYYHEKFEKDFTLNSQMSNISKIYDIECFSKNRIFKIAKLTISLNFNVYNFNISYYPLKTGYSYLYYELKTKEIKKIMEEIFELLWNYNMCNECFELLPPNKSICDYCISSKMFWQYGLIKHYVSDIPICLICLDNCYKAKLECGHYFHKTCFINLNNEDFFDEKTDIKCPHCRINISQKDKINYFLI